MNSKITSVDGILHHVVEEFAGAEIGLVAGADDITHRNAERLGAARDRKPMPPD